MDVGVRELKAKLSSYLQLAAGGEWITVTDRGRPLAVLAPIPDAIDLAEAARDGWVTEANGEPLPVVRRCASIRSVASALAEDRDE